MKILDHNPRTTFLDYLTDDFGVWEHSKGEDVDRKEGYALDDSARALIVYLLYGNEDNAEICLSYLEKSFKDGGFYGGFTQTFEPENFPSSDDSFGLAFWALAFAKSQKFQEKRVDKILKNIKYDTVLKNGYLRTLAYMLLGFTYLKDKSNAEKVLNTLIERYDNNLKWFEPKLYYANAVLPYAILMYLRVFKVQDTPTEQVVLNCILILDRYMRIGVIPSPPGNKSWQEIGSWDRDIYGQQPIEAGFMVLLLVEAYLHFEDQELKKSATEWLGWFYGNNIVKETLINERDACADGIDGDRISNNHGSESTIMYLWASKVYLDNFAK